MIFINEIFGPTIQGEGPHVGLKTLFVRVSGCDFSCHFCDSKYAWGVDVGTSEMGETELADYLIMKCEQTNCTNVVLTGGNPCLYDFTLVINKLHDHCITVEVETQGSLLPHWLTLCDLTVFSPKPPYSNMRSVKDSLEKFISSNMRDNHLCIKIPIFTEEDFLFAAEYYEMVQELKKERIDVDLYLSVGNMDTSEEGDITERILLSYEALIDRVNNSSMKRVFILPQVHTLLWGNKRGV